MKQLTDTVYVSGQIQLEDLDAIAGAGINTVINNRPDGEMMGQPLDSDMKQAVEALGLTYISLPMGGGISPDLIQGSIEAYSASDTPILAFCGSGTRSTALWCFANVKSLGVEGVLSTASAAGYNLEQLRTPLQAMVN